MSDLCEFYSRGSDRHYSLSWEMILGTRKAIFLNYITFFVHENRRNRRDQYLIDGSYWWYHSVKQFCSAFPSWSERKIHYILAELKRDGYIQSRTTPDNAALLYTVNGEKLDELFNKGAALIEQREAEIWGANYRAKPVEESAEYAVGGLQKLQSTPPVSGAENAGIEIYTTRDKGEETNDAVADAPASVRKAKDLGQVQGKVKERNLLKAKARFDKVATAQSVEKIWEMLIVETLGRKFYIPMSPIDRKNTRTHFINYCTEAGVQLPELLEYCVTHWDSLRDRMSWAKLGDLPNYGTIYALKDKFLEQMRKNGGGAKKVVAKNLVSSIDQIPKNHPQYAVLRKIVLRGGTVSL